jgi:hypothetical protein
VSSSRSLGVFALVLAALTSQPAGAQTPSSCEVPLGTEAPPSTDAWPGAEAPLPPGALPPPPPDNPAPLPPPAHREAAPVVVEETPPPRASRPRLNVGVGMGASFESAGLGTAGTSLVPAFFATGGVGDDWPIGVELAAFATSASGRFHGEHDAPIDRLALAVVGVARPFAWKLRLDDPRYLARVLRGLAVELGVGVERDGTTIRAGSRVGVHGGARLELPLSRAPERKELRLRFAVRRMQGLYTPRVGAIDVGDGLELYATLVSAF